MKTQEEQFQQILSILNEAYQADPAALHALICNRVPCNEALADHPTIQVQQNNLTPTPSFEVGLVGVLNGIIEALTGKRIAAQFSDKDDQGKSKVLGFCEYKCSSLPI